MPQILPQKVGPILSQYNWIFYYRLLIQNHLFQLGIICRWNFEVFIFYNWRSLRVIMMLLSGLHGHQSFDCLKNSTFIVKPQTS